MLFRSCLLEPLVQGLVAGIGLLPGCGVCWRWFWCWRPGSCWGLVPEAALGRLRWQRLRQFKGRAWTQDPSIPWQAALTPPVCGTPFVAVLKAWRRRLQRERLRGRRYQPSFRRRQIAITSLGALSALALLGLVTLWSGQLLIAAPLGASCVLLFG